MENIKTFKLLLLGSGDVGKSAFLQEKTNFRLDNKLFGFFDGIEMYHLKFNTNYGQILFIIHVEGNNTDLSETSCKDLNGAILMFDFLRDNSLDMIPNYYWQVKEKVYDLPFVLCGNKSDLKQEQEITCHKDKNMAYYEVSVKTGCNLDEPFLHLARKLVGKNDLEFL